jgi:ATP-dependent Lon protease
MVLTRNQKRKEEEVEESRFIDKPLSNITATISKRKRSDDDNMSNSDSDVDVIDEDMFMTETTTEESDNHEHESEDDKEDGVGVSQTQLQDVIKGALRKLVEEYDTEEDAPNADDEYSHFINTLRDVQSGEFFQRIPLENRKKQLKQILPSDQVESLNKELNELKKLYTDNAPSIISILRMDIHPTQKQKLLEKMYQYLNSDVLTAEYNSSLKYLMNNINKTANPELFQLEQQIVKSAQSDEFSDDYRYKILKSNMPYENKVMAFKRLEIMERYEDSDSGEYAKYKNWMDMLLSVPFGKYITTPSMQQMTRDETGEYLYNVRDVLDKRLSFLEKSKDQVLNVVTQMIRNPNLNTNAIGLYGTKGTGKTSIVKSIAEALGRPFRSISMGGESDASLLTGHGFTYVGSNPGRLIELLSETKCMNPVILIDELDKVSQTHQGKEIIGTLIHLTDTSTNAKYNYDRYFSGVEFDLSKVLFVFTYNDPDKVDRILADRLYKIKVDNYSIAEKLEITNKHLVPNILKEFNFKSEEVSFSRDAIEHLVQKSVADEGMRDIKRNLEIIVSRINTLLLTTQPNNVIKLKYKQLHSHYQELPVIVQREHIDVLLLDSVSDSAVKSEPPFGMYT